VQSVQTQVTILSVWKQIDGTKTSIAVDGTFAASTSVLPSVRVALPAVRKQSFSTKKTINEVVRVKRHKVFTRARTLSLHLLSTHSSTKGLFHGTLGGLEVAGDLQQSSTSDAFHVSRTTAKLESFLQLTLLGSLFVILNHLFVESETCESADFAGACGEQQYVFDCAGAKLASTPFGKGIRNSIPISS